MKKNKSVIVSFIDINPILWVSFWKYNAQEASGSMNILISGSDCINKFGLFPDHDSHNQSDLCFYKGWFGIVLADNTPPKT